MEASADDRGSETRSFDLLWRLYYHTFRLGFMQVVKGLEFYRCIENNWFLEYFGDDLKEKRILDIGPWKSPLPTFLARCGADVHVIDVEEGAAIQAQYAKRIGVDNLTAHRMPYFEGDIHFDLPDDGYDVVACVSTIEHFENDGDIGVMSEIRRILVSGGKAFVTVPYGMAYDEHTHYKWFERTYDNPSIDARLCPDGFRVVEQLYFKDDTTLKFTRLYWMLPRAGRFLFGRFWFFVALWYLKRDRATPDNASLCGLILEKI